MLATAGQGCNQSHMVAGAERVGAADLLSKEVLGC